VDSRSSSRKEKDKTPLHHHWIEKRVESHIFLCLLSQVVLGKVRRKLKEEGWLGKKKENTLEKFITLLGTIQLGKFSIEDKKIICVQKKNPLKDVLFEVFNLPSFDFIRDREICRV